MIGSTGTTAKLRRDTGQVVYFTWSGSSWTPQVGEFGTLTGSTSAGFTYTSKVGTAYGFDSTVYSRLVSITPADHTGASGLTITYSDTSPTQIYQVANEAGPILTFSYGANLHISGRGKLGRAAGRLGVCGVKLAEVGHLHLCRQVRGLQLSS